MKAAEFFKIFSFALLAFLNPTGSYAASPVAESAYQNFLETDTLQQDQHSHPLYFEDASPSYQSQIKSENYRPVSRTNTGLNIDFVDSANSELNTNRWTFTPDLRDYLENQIFPFHFFW